MTRDEFLDTVVDFYDLIRFCNDEDSDICEDIYDDDQYDDAVEDDISNRDCGWRRLRDELEDLPTGHDFYRRNGWLNYDGLDDRDFEEYKDSVIDWMDAGEYWDDDPDEEEYEPFEEPEEPEDPDGFEVDDMDFIQVLVEAQESFSAVATANVQQLRADGKNVTESLDQCLYDVTHL